jgi:hypothetical protein
VIGFSLYTPLALVSVTLFVLAAATGSTSSSGVRTRVAVFAAVHACFASLSALLLVAAAAMRSAPELARERLLGVRDNSLFRVPGQLAAVPELGVWAYSQLIYVYLWCWPQLLLVQPLLIALLSGWRYWISYALVALDIAALLCARHGLHWLYEIAIKKRIREQARSRYRYQYL